MKRQLTVSLIAVSLLASGTAFAQSTTATGAVNGAMCGRLRFGKSFLDGFAALVGAAMCSAF